MSKFLCVKNMILKNVWCGHKHVVDHFTIFGCVAYAHVPYPKRNKLNDKGDKCIVLNVSEVYKAYRLYNPVTKKVCISKDVVFDEIGIRNREKHDKGKSVPLELEDNGDVKVEKDAHNDSE